MASSGGFKKNVSNTSTGLENVTGTEYRQRSRQCLTVVPTARNWFSIFATTVVVMILVNIYYVHNNNHVRGALSRDLSDKDRFLNGNENYVNVISDLKRQLARAEEEIHTLQQQKDQHEQQQQQQRQQQSLQQGEAQKDEPPSDGTSQSPICQKIPLLSRQPTPSTSSLWSSHLSHIFASSRHPRDDSFLFHDFTAVLLHLLSPLRLSRSVKTLPRHSDVGHAVEKLIARYDYLQNKDKRKKKDVVPPLRILVMGGSVTLGVRCAWNPITSQMGRYGRLGCAWPLRLEKFINLLLGFDGVEIENVSIGGTNSEMATYMYQWGLLGRDPDIVIHAYSTNDMHVLSSEHARVRGLSLEDAVFETTQSFIRAVLSPRRRRRGAGDEDCGGRRPPLLVFLNEYLGNEQREIVTTTAVGQIMTLLCGYYNVMSVSYADVVRDWVYADTKEGWFSPEWYDEKGGFVREIHLPTGGHISIMWIIAYNFLNALTLFCSHDTRKGGANTEGQYGYHDNHNGLPTLKSQTPIANGPAIRADDIIPPELTKNTSLETISQLWHEAPAITASSTSPNCPSSSSTPSLCPFAWVCGLQNMKDEKHLQAVMKSPRVVNLDGWVVEKESNKMGFVPQKPGASFTVSYENLPTAVDSVTLMVMKSYGEKWDASRISVTVSEKGNAGDNWVPALEEREITGFHESHVSVTYTYYMELKRELPMGSSLKMDIRLIGGSYFKIQGMAFCGS
eukprot:CAMPEP_0172493530 /NCGR_PEP_ID=MMETSP1066-20121228/24978_1 /TAXON_ID=671091 /ORGANISM="Coscinodiscus wailesii, Strain CCMP2513" /LENGTH=731 /DNA_ID=CAMNT_0013263741 /DNA_START=75 /DNA_END=2270 /DNA_ORIENTATION=-